MALDSVEGSRTTTDLALRLAVLSPTSDGDLALAAQHRPALFFDSDEPYPTPLNVDRLVASGKLRLCEQGQAVGAVCSAVDDPGDLRNGATHLRFDPDELAGITDGSTIYTHVTRAGNDHPNSIYLDYWWYFPHNPAGAGGGALCGAGFVIAGITCFDHQSDWEGVTVVLNADSPDTPTAVAYAQHGGVTRYSWRALERLWDDGDRVNFGRGVDTGARPLVFVGPRHARRVPDQLRRRALRRRRPARQPRRAPDPREPARRRRALAARRARRLPVDLPGGAAAARARAGARLWNAFDGGWGTSDCVLEFVCASSAPPRSPGFQGRYRHPWCATEVVGWTGPASPGRTRHARAAVRPPPRSQATSGCSRSATPSRPGRARAPTTPRRTAVATPASALRTPGRSSSPGGST